MAAIKFPKNTNHYTILRKRKGYRAVVEKLRGNEMSWREDDYPTLAEAKASVAEHVRIDHKLGIKTKVILPKKRRKVT